MNTKSIYKLKFCSVFTIILINVLNFNINAQDCWNVKDSSYFMGFEYYKEFDEGEKDFLYWDIYDPTYTDAFAHNGLTGFNSDFAILCQGEAFNKGYLFSRCFVLDSGMTYKLTFWYNAMVENPSMNMNIKIFIGNKQDSSAMKNCIMNLENIPDYEVYKKQILNFNVNKDSIYYLAWNIAYGKNKDASMVSIDNVSLEKYICDTVSVKIVASNTGICKNSGDSVLLSVNYNTNYTYDWNNGISEEKDIWVKEPGEYFIKIIDNRYCIGRDTIIINEFSNPEIEIETSSGKNFICQNNRLKLFVNNKSSSHINTYEWNDSLSFQENIEVDTAGIFKVKVTDNNNCSNIDTIIIINTSVYDVQLISHGSTLLCYNDSLMLEADILNDLDSNYTFKWLPDKINGDSILWVEKEGLYSFVATNKYGCSVNSDSINIYVQYPIDEQDICIVTVDKTTGKNAIVWEKDYYQGIKSYNIYKENTNGTYSIISNVPFENMSKFIDSTSNPLQKASRYKISAIDICNQESKISSPHKTMHLTVNRGINYSRNLIWDKYEGFDFSTYRIYRDTSLNFSTFELIDSIQNNLFTYTDFSTSNDKEYYYMLEVVSDNFYCYYDKKNKGYIYSSFSNIASDKNLSIENYADNDNIINIYPNPCYDLFFINYAFSEPSEVIIEIYNIIGKQIYNQTNKYQVAGTHYKTLDLTNMNFTKGLYFIKIKINNKTFVNKLIKL